MIKRLFLALAICGTSLAQAQEPPIRIGVIGPFTGKSSTDMGEAIRGGARVFAEEVNRLGGVLGRRIELVEKDDQAKPDVGVVLAKELIEKDKVVAAVGFANYGVASKAVPEFQKAKLPFIVSAAAGGELTLQPDLAPGAPNYIFRLAGRDWLQTKAMFKDLVDRRKITEVAILHDDTPYGKAGRDNALKEMRARKLKPLTVASFKIGDQDMTAQLNRAKAAGAKAIALYGLATEDAMVVRSLAKMGWKVPVVGTWTMSQQTFIQLAGPAAEGTRSAVTFVEDEWAGAKRDFLTAYRKLNKTVTIPSGVAAAQTYDALRLLYLAIFQVNNTQPDSIRAALEDLQISARSTVVSRYDRPFTPADHEAITDNMVVMSELRGGKIVYAYREDENSALIARVKK